MSNAKSPSAEINPAVAADRLPQRVRHPLRFRELKVRAVERVTPHLVRVTLEGAALEGFLSPGFDDHVKLVFPDPETGRLVLPTVDEEGRPVWPDGPKPVMRDYTPRHFDAAARVLDIEFVLHGDGVASPWAEAAKPGDEVGLGGPRGSFVVPTGFDWHVLVGDETAIPAIARRLEELPATAQAITVIATADAGDRRSFSTRARLQTHWIETGSTNALARQVAALTLPPGEGFAWAAGEAASMVAVRQALVEQHGLDKARVRASAYWKRGSAGHHETL